MRVVWHWCLVLLLVTEEAVVVAVMKVLTNILHSPIVVTVHLDILVATKKLKHYLSLILSTWIQYDIDTFEEAIRVQVGGDPHVYINNNSVFIDMNSEAMYVSNTNHACDPEKDSNIATWYVFCDYFNILCNLILLKLLTITTIIITLKTIPILIPIVTKQKRTSSPTNHWIHTLIVIQHTIVVQSGIRGCVAA